MNRILFPLKVILLALKPISKTADIWDWRDIINLVLLSGLGGGGKMIQQWVTLDWVKISYLAFVPALLLFIAALKLQKKTSDYESKNPIIVFQRGDVGRAALFKQKQFVPLDQEMDKSKALGLKVYFVYVFVKNDPQGYRSKQRTAEKAVAAIEIYETNNLKTPLLSYWGSWRDTAQVFTRPSHAPFEDLMTFDLLPNGLPHRIDFALKYHEDDNMYGYNDEAQRYSKDGRHDPLKLPPKQFLVKVRLKAVGLGGEPSWWYRVNNGGKQTKPTIQQLTKEEIKKLRS